MGIAKSELKHNKEEQIYLFQSSINGEEENKITENAELLTTGGVKIIKGNNVFTWTSCEECYFKIENTIEGINLNLLQINKTISNIVKTTKGDAMKISDLNNEDKSILSATPYTGKIDGNYQYNYTLNNKFVEYFAQEFWEGCIFQEKLVTCPFGNGKIVIDYTNTYLQGITLDYDEKINQMRLNGDLSIIDPFINYTNGVNMIQDGYIFYDLTDKSYISYTNWNLTPFFAENGKNLNIMDAQLSFLVGQGDADFQQINVSLMDNQSVVFYPDAHKQVKTNSTNLSFDCSTTGWKNISIMTQLLQVIRNTSTNYLPLELREKDGLIPYTLSPDIFTSGEYKMGTNISDDIWMYGSESATASYRPRLFITYNITTPSPIYNCTVYPMIDGYLATFGVRQDNNPYLEVGDESGMLAPDYRTYISFNSTLCYGGNITNMYLVMNVTQIDGWTSTDRINIIRLNNTDIDAVSPDSLNMSIRFTYGTFYSNKTGISSQGIVTIPIKNQTAFQDFQNNSFFSIGLKSNGDNDDHFIFFNSSETGLPPTLIIEYDYCSPPDYGDWHINTSCVITDKKYNVNGMTWLDDNANLTLIGTTEINTTRIKGMTRLHLSNSGGRIKLK